MKKNKRLDARLVKAYQSGNQEALAALVKRWHKQFCSKAFWIVKDVDVAKDIAQDTWQTIINKIETLNDPSSFGNWASRIIYSKSLDILREKSKIQNQQEILKRESTIIQDVTNDNSDLKIQLLKTINSLPEQQQIVIRLFYIEEYSLKDISKTLNITIGTTKSRLFYAREKLKLTLKNNDYEK